MFVLFLALHKYFTMYKHTQVHQHFKIIKLAPSTYKHIYNSNANFNSNANEV